MISRESWFIFNAGWKSLGPLCCLKQTNATFPSIPTTDLFSSLFNWELKPTITFDMIYKNKVAWHFTILKSIIDSVILRAQTDFWEPIIYGRITCSAFLQVKGLGPASSWYTRLCWLPKGGLTASEEWRGMGWERCKGPGEGEGGGTEASV